MTAEEADALQTDPRHFTKAVTDLGEKQPLLATRAIFNQQGIKIAEKGAAINSRMYERLMQHTLAEPLEESLAPAAPVTAEELRETAEVLLMELPLLARMTEDPKVRTLLLDVVAKIPLPPPMVLQLTLSRELLQEGFVHAVKSALVAGWLSITPTALRFDIGMAAAAGLLHDVGMLHLDPVLLQPDHALSGAQQRQLYSHPLVATVLLQRHHEYPRELVRAVAEHHEQLNGSGYPRGLAGDAISPLGRVLALTEVVAAMLASDREAPELRLSVLLRMNAQRFDAALTHRVMLLLRPEWNAAGALSLVLPDPVTLLCDIDDTLGYYPLGAAKAPGLDRERLDGLNALAAQAAQLQRTLANVGAAREQLQQLGDDGVDELLKVELSLLARESVWQLRAMTRQARRRWRGEPQLDLPPDLQEWLQRAEALAEEGLRAPAMPEREALAA